MGAFEQGQTIRLRYDRTVHIPGVGGGANMEVRLRSGAVGTVADVDLNAVYASFECGPITASVWLDHVLIDEVPA